jgi:hypothetical protein
LRTIRSRVPCKTWDRVPAIALLLAIYRRNMRAFL